MFNMGLGEILVVVAVALVFVGPTKLPEIARTVGRGLGRLRRASDEVRDTIQSEINSLEREEIKKKIETDKTAAGGPYSGADPDIQEAAPQPTAAPGSAIRKRGVTTEAQSEDEDEDEDEEEGEEEAGRKEQVVAEPLPPADAIESRVVDTDKKPQ